MAAYITPYAYALEMDLIFGAQSLTPPSTWYIGLCYAPATANGLLRDLAGNASELTGGSSPGYARVAVANNTTNWPSAASSQQANGTAITFASPTGTWQTPLSAFLADASTGGNVWRTWDLEPHQWYAPAPGLPPLSWAANTLRFTSTMIDGVSNKLFNLEFGQTSFTIPATYTLGLNAAVETQVPPVNSSNSYVVDTFGHPSEPGPGPANVTNFYSAPGYARVSIANNTTNFPAISGGLGPTLSTVKKLATVASFPTATGNAAGVDGLSYPICGAFLASGSPGFIWHAWNFSAPKQWVSGQTRSFPANTIQFNRT